MPDLDDLFGNGDVAHAASDAASPPVYPDVVRRGHRRRNARWSVALGGAAAVVVVLLVGATQLIQPGAPSGPEPAPNNPTPTSTTPSATVASSPPRDPVDVLANGIVDEVAATLATTTPERSCGGPEIDPWWP